ncbi:hypothetical protein [Acutalibacter sp. 1XD8-33]|uniref:hypothetical protein n=1 Tax=Acutalibacter sp. 1XD8-33 TaxID=2320081 RepID=UPI0011C44AEF|nr:hypothetical protein [Acutalibacter sp. 1XD8-33]
MSHEDFVGILLHNPFGPGWSSGLFLLKSGLLRLSIIKYIMSGQDFPYFLAIPKKIYIPKESIFLKVCFCLWQLGGSSHPPEAKRSEASTAFKKHAF